MKKKNPNLVENQMSLFYYFTCVFFFMVVSNYSTSVVGLLNDGSSLIPSVDVRQTVVFLFFFNLFLSSPGSSYLHQTSFLFCDLLEASMVFMMSSELNAHDVAVDLISVAE